MSDTKPLPDDPDRTAATPATPAPAADPPAAAAGPVPGEPVWAAEPAPAAAAPPPAAPPPPAPAAPAVPAAPDRLHLAGQRLRHPGARVTLLVSAATLVLGCCLGAGMVAVGAAVLGHHDRGDDRGHFTRDERGPGGPAGRRDGDDRRIRPGDKFRRQPSPATPPTPATPTTPASPAASPS